MRSKSLKTNSNFRNTQIMFEKSISIIKKIVYCINTKSKIMAIKKIIFFAKYF